MKEALTGNYAFWLNGRIAMWRSEKHFNLHGDDNDGVYVHVRNAKGYKTRWLKAAFGSIAVWNGKKRKPLHESEIDVHWMDDHSACVKMSTDAKVFSWI